MITGSVPVDEEGRTDKEFAPVIDGTLKGPNTAPRLSHFVGRFKGLECRPGRHPWSRENVCPPPP